ncbi:MAG TPA: APC family permease, partial [Solirubrobacteraceae bacterium]|nr:APC family permease [Solirubrobacteraceae bacterium]
MKPLAKTLGAPALFGIVQGFVAASVYFAVGLVAQRALGFSWLVFLTGGLVFACVVVSYVEGASLHQERGGATVIARFAFNELVSFIAGWAICLEYVILIAICAFATTDYAAVFWGELDAGVPELALASALVLFVAWWNARGSAAPLYRRGVLVVLGDLALQLLIVAFGVAYLVEPDLLTDPASVAGTPSLEDLMFAFPLVLVAFSGLDASSGLAGQVAIGRRGLRRLIAVRMLAALVPYVGIAVVASATLPREPAGIWLEAPMLGVVDAFSQEWLHDPLRYVVAVSAVAILAGACSAAMLGVSRLGYSLALNRQ